MRAEQNPIGVLDRFAVRMRNHRPEADSKRLGDFAHRHGVQSPLFAPVVDAVHDASRALDEEIRVAAHIVG
ncbi:MAG: hypothetical protein ACJA1R_002011, partial [Flavobacteriales bacterium]